MSDRYIVFVEVHAHNLRHFLHQQRWAVIRYDWNTGYFETDSSRVLLELIQYNMTSTLKPSLPSLFLSSLISLIWLFTPSLCSFTWLPFCVLNTKKNALPIMSLAACASETNDFYWLKKYFLFSATNCRMGESFPWHQHPLCEWLLGDRRLWETLWR